MNETQCHLHSCTNCYAGEWWSVTLLLLSIEKQAWHYNETQLVWNLPTKSTPWCQKTRAPKSTHTPPIQHFFWKVLVKSQHFVLLMLVLMQSMMSFKTSTHPLLCPKNLVIHEKSASEALPLPHLSQQITASVLIITSHSIALNGNPKLKLSPLSHPLPTSDK